MFTITHTANEKKLTISQLKAELAELAKQSEDLKKQQHQFNKRLKKITRQLSQLTDENIQITQENITFFGETKEFFRLITPLFNSPYWHVNQSRKAKQFLRAVSKSIKITNVRAAFGLRFESLYTQMKQFMNIKEG